MTAHPLQRRADHAWEPAPVRMVHLGLGAFFRAHQAWYTDQASDRNEWGIAAFTGRSKHLPEVLTAQEGLYTLTTRDPAQDSCEVIASVVAAHAGSDTDAWRLQMAAPEVEVLTLTVTEAGYGNGPMAIAPRLLDGLEARRKADAGPITLVPCDNLPDNDGVLRVALTEAASSHSPALEAWIDESVSIVGSVVDRITPAVTSADHAAARHHGWKDDAPVVTEPFTEWVLAGSFTGAHPDWVSAGAQFVDDLGPYSRRKLRLLNGAHTLLAHVGWLRGHLTVADACRDEVVLAAIQDWWAEAGPTIGLEASEVTAYTAALQDRFVNERIRHLLAQIAIDGSQKLPARVVPVARLEREAGRSAQASALQFGAWVAFVRANASDLIDVRAEELRAAASGPLGDAARRLTAIVAPELADDVEFMSQLIDAAQRLDRGRAR